MQKTEFMVMSKKEAVKYSYHLHKKQSVIISISNVGESRPCFSRQVHNGIRSICYLQFDDVEKGEENAITEKDAQKIAAFINRFKGEIPRIIVHCEAGISRSAGVCAAIMKYLTGSDIQIFKNPKYVPNMSCYRMLLDSLLCYVPEEEIQHKHKINMEVWMKRFERSFG